MTSSAEAVTDHLRAIGSAKAIAGMARFGIGTGAHSAFPELRLTYSSPDFA